MRQRGFIWAAALPYIGYALLAALAIGGIGYGVHRYNESIRAPLKAQIAGMERLEADRQKMAAAQIAQRTKENATAVQGYIDYARTSENDHAQKMAALRNAVNAANGVRFYDPGRGSCPATGQAGTSGALTAESPAPPWELSSESSSFLRAEAARADEVSEYAESCYRFVNQK